MTYANRSSLYTAVGSMPVSSSIGKTILESVSDPIPVKLILEESFALSCYLPAMVITLISLYLLSNYIVFIVNSKCFQKGLPGTKRVLLVTAHPDDECMFFGPTLTYLTSVADVYLVCLSEGGYEGLSRVRSKELWMSCDKLGINAGNVRLYRHPLLPDNPKSSWNPLLIGHIIIQIVETLSIDTLITFDAYGVSGHLNHTAIYRAIMHLSGKRAIPSYCKIYVLESVSIVRKYSICTDLLLSYCKSQYMYTCSRATRRMILEAMAQHSSQLVWFRRLFLMFSRYSYINTYKAIS